MDFDLEGLHRGEMLFGCALARFATAFQVDCCMALEVSRVTHMHETKMRDDRMLAKRKVTGHLLLHGH